MNRAWLLCILIMVFYGCAAPQPVLYPNAHLQQVGHYRAEQDIAYCRSFAEQYVHNTALRDTARQTAWGAAGGAALGAVIGAIDGDLGTRTAVGAATGATAGLLHGAYRSSQPSPLYRRFVEQCLRERGYIVAGWQ